MKWYAIIFWFGWVLPSVISFLRLFFDKERGTVKFFFTYCWWSFVPLWNIVLVYFVGLEVRDWAQLQIAKIRVAIHEQDEEEREALEYAATVWGVILAAIALFITVYYIIFGKVVL